MIRRFFSIPGQPHGKARARTVSQGGHVHSYTPEKTALYERLVRDSYKFTYQNAEKLTGPVELRITAFFQIPNSWPMRRKQEACAGMIPVVVKPDCDNILKIVADALNNLAWDDDKQITLAQVEKKYAPEPRVEVEIYGGEA